MDRFYGFDLGDAESAVSRLDKTISREPEMLDICREKSIITAYALLPEGKLIIGESACYAPDAAERKIRFKSRFLTDPAASKDIRSFAAGVLGELYLSGELIKGEDTCVYVGCPAGWDRQAREEYREIFEKTGYPPVRIISESRAALVYACQSRHLQVGYDILSKPVLVIDIGSSTTDFAYICGGREVELRTGGEVFLGGGIMDEILLEESVRRSKNEKKIREIFEKSSAWKSYCEFAARRLKEKYFSDEDYWQEHECSELVSIRYTGSPVKLRLVMNPETAAALTNKGVERLGGRSFKEEFEASLKQAKSGITEKHPELIFLTGGVSRLPAIRQWCRDVFPDAVVVTGSEPEFSVARGLSLCALIDDELREFRKEVEDLRASSTVEQIVAPRIGELYQAAVDVLVDPILKNAALPVIERWRNGEIDRLSEIDGYMQKEIDAYIHSAEAKELLTKPIAAWLRPVAYALEEYTMPICIRHNIPYSALNLTSYLAASDIDIKVDSKDIFAVEEITWMIDTIVSVMIGLLCGGSGIAMIAQGLPGVIAGAVISLLVLALGQEKMQSALMKVSIPRIARKAVPSGYYTSRLDKISREVRKNLLESLKEEKNEEITDRLVREISEQIETCLAKMAEIVEIPLG